MAFFCFRKKLPWSKTNHYDCNGIKEKHGMKISKAGAADEDYGPYESKEVIDSNGMNACPNNKNRLDKYGIDIQLDGSLRRSKKKKKKVQKMKLKANEKKKENEGKKDERARLASILDNATADSPVEIITSLVDSYGPTQQNQFEVKIGDKAIAMYRKGDFIHVRRFDGLSGFVPVQLCFLVGEFISHSSKDNFVSCESTVDGSLVNLERPSSKQSERRTPMQEVSESQQNSREIPLREESSNLMPECRSSPVKQFTPADSVSDLNDKECDSLARKVNRHEIRQLLKQDTSQKMAVNNRHNSGKQSVEEESQTFLQKSQQLIEKLENGEAGLSREIDTQQGNSTLVEPTLNTRASNSTQHLDSNPHLQTSRASVKANSKQNINESTGSQHSLNSLKPKTSMQSLLSERMKVYSNGPLQNIPRENGTLNNNGIYEMGSQKALRVRSRLDNQSLSSYDGSLQEVHAKLNGNGRYFAKNSPSGGYFYQNEEPASILESRIHDLLCENQFVRSRRCSSLRKVGNQGIHPNNHFNGHGHGYSPRLADDERSWKIYAENFSAPGSRIISPLGFGYQYSPSVSDSLEESMTAGDRFMFALQDFRSVEKDDLDLRKGERVQVLRNDSESWWWVRNSHGEEGFVPSHFLIPLLKPSQLSLSTSSDFGSRSGTLSYPERIRGDESEALKSNEVYTGKLVRRQESFGMKEEDDLPLARLVRSNTIGSESRGLKGTKIDWTKMYNTGKGHLGLSGLKEMNGYRSGEVVQSKEALLMKIRGEVERDPMKLDFRRNGRVPSSENIHKINIRSAEVGKRHINGPQRRVLSSEKIYSVNAEELKEPVNNNPLPTSSSIYTSDAEIVTDKKYIKKPQLPSYEQCVNLNEREESGHGQHLSSNGNLSEDSGMFETPRVLRRRRTYSGASNNKKVRFNQGENGQPVAKESLEGNGRGALEGNEEPVSTASTGTKYDLSEQPDKGLPGGEEGFDPGLSTWC